MVDGGRKKGYVELGNAHINGYSTWQGTGTQLKLRADKSDDQLVMFLLRESSNWISIGLERIKHFGSAYEVGCPIRNAGRMSSITVAVITGCDLSLLSLVTSMLSFINIIHPPDFYHARCLRMKSVRCGNWFATKKLHFLLMLDSDGVWSNWQRRSSEKDCAFRISTSQI